MNEAKKRQEERSEGDERSGKKPRELGSEAGKRAAVVKKTSPAKTFLVMTWALMSMAWYLKRVFSKRCKLTLI